MRRPQNVKKSPVCFFLKIWEENIRKQTPYLSALDFYNSPVWNIKFGELNLFFEFNCFFVACTGSKNSFLNWKKNPVDQTRIFKLKNVKNQMQIDMGWGCNLEIPYILTVLPSIPFDKLPWSRLLWWHSICWPVPFILWSPWRGPRGILLPPSSDRTLWFRY